jgi:S1-C subfamily serine protease
MSRAARFGARFIGVMVVSLWLAPAAWPQRVYGGFGIDLEPDSDGTGVAIREVYANGSADRGWLRSSDVIERINDRPTPNLLEYRRIMAGLAVGDTAVIDYRRGKKKRTARLIVEIEPLPTVKVRRN